MGSGATAAAATGTVEDWGPVNAFLSGVADPPLGVRRCDPTCVAQPQRRRGGGPRPHRGGTRRRQLDRRRPAHDAVVIGSGNLGGVWFTGHVSRLTRRTSRSTGRHARSLAGIRASPSSWSPLSGMARSIGRNGLHRLLSGEVEGIDPMAPFGPEAARTSCGPAGSPCPRHLPELDVRPAQR